MHGRCAHPQPRLQGSHHQAQICFQDFLIFFSRFRCERDSTAIAQNSKKLRNSEQGKTTFIILLKISYSASREELLKSENNDNKKTLSFHLF